MDIKKKLIYIHIPKCGGMSIGAGLALSYYPITLIKKGRSGFGRFNPSAASISANSLGVHLFDYSRTLLHYHINCGETPLIAGHFNFCPEEFSKYRTTWSFTTVLRDPVSRWYSAFFYRRLSKNNNHSNTDLDIEEFFMSEKGWEDSRSFVDFLTNRNSSTKKVSQSDVNNTLDSLESFAVVGFLEDTRHFSKNMQHEFGRKLLLPKRNRRPKGEHNLTVPDKNSTFHKNLLKRLEPEIEIYEIAKERYLIGV